MRGAGDEEETWRSALGHRLARQLVQGEGCGCRRLGRKPLGLAHLTDFLTRKEVTA